MKDQRIDEIRKRATVPVTSKRRLRDREDLLYLLAENAKHRRLVAAEHRNRQAMRDGDFDAIATTYDEVTKALDACTPDEKGPVPADAALLREARASVLLDHDPDCGTRRVPEHDETENDDE